MRTHVFLFSLVASALLLVAMLGVVQSSSTSELSRGVVIEKVVCQDDATQSYALYLPSSYSPEKKWPVLYIFDPFGNGNTPVEIFHEAAEKYGFVVVGSNNSQNNQGAEKLAAITNAFWKDSHSRFSIDEKRVYAAGLSGGARVANYLAISCSGCVAGVIASGAAFTPKAPLDKPLSYSLFGTVGFDDLNYPEMIKTFETLRANGTVSHLAVFDGRHQWLTKDLTYDALEWMNLQAMKSGRIETDKRSAENLYVKQMGKAQSFERRGDILEAARTYEAIVNDFKGVLETKHGTEKLSELRNQESFKQALAEEERSFNEQSKTAKKIFSMGADLLDSSKNKTALQRVSSEIGGWRQKAKAPADSNERRLARRILGQVFVEAYEAALYVNRKQKDYQTMIANLELTRLINPQSPDTLLELARALALGGRKQDALNTLEQAIKNGFTDCSQIIGKPEWEILRGDKQFQKLMQGLRCADKT